MRFHTNGCLCENSCSSCFSANVLHVQNLSDCSRETSTQIQQKTHTRYYVCAIMWMRYRSFALRSILVALRSHVARALSRVSPLVTKGWKLICLNCALLGEQNNQNISNMHVVKETGSQVLNGVRASGSEVELERDINRFWTDLKTIKAEQ